MYDTSDIRTMSSSPRAARCSTERWVVASFVAAAWIDTSVTTRSLIVRSGL